MGARGEEASTLTESSMVGGGGGARRVREPDTWGRSEKWLWIQLGFMKKG